MAKGIRWTSDDLAAFHKKTARAHSPRGGEKLQAPARDLPKSQSALRLEQQLQAFPPHVKEWFPIAGRNFRLDYAWPDEKVAIELQGGVHRIKGKWVRDFEKRALLMIAGWRVLELDGKSIKEERSVEWLKALL